MAQKKKLKKGRFNATKKQFNGNHVQNQNPREDYQDVLTMPEIPLSLR